MNPAVLFVTVVMMSGLVNSASLDLTKVLHLKPKAIKEESARGINSSWKYGWMAYMQMIVKCDTIAHMLDAMELTMADLSGTFIAEMCPGQNEITSSQGLLLRRAIEDKSMNKLLNDNFQATQCFNLVFESELHTIWGIISESSHSMVDMIAEPLLNECAEYVDELDEYAKRASMAYSKERSTKTLAALLNKAKLH